MKPWIVLIVWGISSSHSSAQSSPVEVSVLVSNAAAAPTPQQIVDFDYASAAEPPLKGTLHPRPSRARYLLPFRAEGDFAQVLAREPDSARAALERYVVFDYDANVANAALLALNADVQVVYANIDPPPLPPAGLSALPSPPIETKAATQTWLADVGIPDAWQLAGGWSLVGVLDSGLQTSHPDLVAFDVTGKLTGGNFLPIYSADLGTKTNNGPLPYDLNVDELEPEAKPPGLAASCDPDGDGLMIASLAGHGTHVAGLVGANASNGDGIQGACRQCGIAMGRQSMLGCKESTGTVFAGRTIPGTVAALTLQADLGVQVISMSFGSAISGPDDFCLAHVNDKMCLALTYAATRDVILVAASGNSRSRIAFPAGDARVVAVGGSGTQADPLALWDEDTVGPSFTDACPLVSECGSNFSQVNLPERQEALAPARRVLGAIYAGANYNSEIMCGDPFGTPLGDGIGTCTGTSMSAPIYAGAAGIVRSINPLVPAGDPDSSVKAPGVRNLMARGSYRPTPLSWDARFGFGVIQADEAVRQMLGRSRGSLVRNRLTPLFAFRSNAIADHAYTTSPQSASAFAKYAAGQYQPIGANIRGYGQFPGVEASTPPRAELFVLTTEFWIDEKHPAPVPLYWLSRKQTWPPGCIGGSCITGHVDHLLASSRADVEALRASGFEYRGVQGYLHPACSPEPMCIPHGAERVHRLCRAADDDCAVFGDHELAAMQAAGYGTAVQSGAPTMLGYAYRNVHGDGDHLIDGAEILLGTNPLAADSDGDLVCDHLEFPVASVPASDPCNGNRCGPDAMFGHGFEQEVCQ